MKIVSPQIPHKSCIGGIKLSLQNTAEVKDAYQDMMDNIPKNCLICPLKAYSCS
jgi:acyl-CoA synthetase (NDP forming)